jgi:hypothetical protein
LRERPESTLPQKVSVTSCYFRPNIIFEGKAKSLLYPKKVL